MLEVLKMPRWIHSELRIKQLGLRILKSHVFACVERQRSIHIYLFENKHNTMSSVSM